MSVNIKNNAIKEILRGSISAVIFSVLFVLIFALLARIFSFSADFVSVINTIIKVLSVFFAVVFFSKIREKGFVKGVAIAFGFLFISNLIFMLLGGKTGLKDLFFDAILCLLSGVIGAIIAVNKVYC